MKRKGKGFKKEKQEKWKAKPFDRLRGLFGYNTSFLTLTIAPP